MEAAVDGFAAFLFGANVSFATVLGSGRSRVYARAVGVASVDGGAVRDTQGI